MDEIVRTKWAGAKQNGDLVCVKTYSGYRSCRADPQGKQHVLSSEVGDQELGEAVLDSLSHSRFVTPEEDMALFDYHQVGVRYSEWMNKLMARFEYKTKRAMFKDMKSCDIECRDGFITICPTHHEKLEGWSGDGISTKDNVVIPTENPAVEVGAALRLAFSRCT